MKPYVVEFTLRSVIMADDEHHAFSVARDQFREIARDAAPDVWVENEVRNASDLPDGWDLACLPYGGDGNTRLAAMIGEADDSQKGGEA
jgi:hypothetical protein